MQHSFIFLGTGLDDDDDDGVGVTRMMVPVTANYLPIGRSVNRKAKSQEPKKKSVYVRKEFPETWLWTEEMVK